jgi:hypothetical protein
MITVLPRYLLNPRVFITESGINRGSKEHTPTYCKYVRFEVFTEVTMKDCLLEYKNPVHTSQETHYFSATELSQLML